MFDSLYHELRLFKRTLTILLLVEEHGPVGIRRLSGMTGNGHHKVRSSLQLLEGEGYIESTPDGAIPTAETQTYLAEVDDDVDGVTARIISLPTELPEATRVER